MILLRRCGGGACALSFPTQVAMVTEIPGVRSTDNADVEWNDSENLCLVSHVPKDNTAQACEPQNSDLKLGHKAS